mgnify:CR=1 FL=1
MYLIFKRVFDLLFSCVLLVLLFPLLLVVGLFIYFIDGSPVFFLQKRAGLNGLPFQLIKFRTMNFDKESGQNNVTKLGRLLRSTSIDELPSLINIALGSMSLIGPRPLHHFYVERYSAKQFRRLAVLPGITGYAQINGRNALDWNEKFELDCFYVDNISLKLDLYILCKTFFVVLFMKDVNPANSSEMPEFLGSDDSK